MISTNLLLGLTTMARAELEKSWAITVQHLEAARALISASSAPGSDGGTLTQYQEFLEHNELELALDELADVGNGSSPPPISGADSAELQKIWG
ncbi:MAG: hypothetical protein SF172_02205 [Burkholderiales bacterium]|nr:hypothetical protein [Burkholderiales bacterium]